MQNITEFLEERKRSCEERADKINEQVAMFKRGYVNNENAYGNIAGHPNAKVVDEMAEQYNRAVNNRMNYML